MSIFFLSGFVMHRVGREISLLGFQGGTGLRREHIFPHHGICHVHRVPRESREREISLLVDFIKRRYARMLAYPLHWFIQRRLAWYVGVHRAYNYRTIVNDYNFWQNKSGEINLILGIALTPFSDAIVGVFAVLLEFRMLESQLSARILFLFSVAH